MSKVGLLFLVVCAVFVPQVGSAQVSPQQNYPVITDPAAASRQAAGEPIYFDGQFYYPSGPITFFDPNVMVRSWNISGHRGLFRTRYRSLGASSTCRSAARRSGPTNGFATESSEARRVRARHRSRCSRRSTRRGLRLSAVPSCQPSDRAAYEGPSAPAAGAAAAPAAEPPRHVSIMTIPAPTGDSGTVGRIQRDSLVSRRRLGDARQRSLRSDRQLQGFHEYRRRRAPTTARSSFPRSATEPRSRVTSSDKHFAVSIWRHRSSRPVARSSSLPQAPRILSSSCLRVFVVKLVISTCQSFSSRTTTGTGLKA